MIVRRVAVLVIHLRLSLVLLELKGGGDEHVDKVLFLVDLYADVAICFWPWRRHDTSGRPEAAEGGDLCFAPFPSTELRYEAFVLLFWL